MQIGILVAGTPPEELAHDFPDYGQMAYALLRGCDPTLSARFYNVREMEFPAAVEENDAYLITGSKHSAYEPLPWIGRLEDLIRELDQRQVPLVGICFGHQLIAQALGGEVRKAEQGWGVGVHAASLQGAAPWIDDDGEFELVVSHQDQVQSLPPGAEKIAGSAFCPLAMYRKQGHVFAMQAHPEFSREFSQGLMDVRAEIIGAETRAAGIESLSREIDSARVGRWICRFLEQAVAAKGKASAQ